MTLRLPLLLVVLVLAGLPAAAQDADVIRVRVLAASTHNSGQIVAESGSVVLKADGRIVATLQSGDRAGIRAAAGRVNLDYPGGTTDVNLVEAIPGPGALVGLRAGNTRRRYDGALRVDADHAPGLRFVAYVPIEPYVAAVVAGEYPFPEIEGIKAQAVLARTYALQRRGQYDDHDVVDSVMDQVYPGADGAIARTRRAAEETRGEVLSYAGAIAEVFYGSSNGGYTADNDEIWDRAPIPYLRARPDPYDRVSPDARWTSRIPVDRLHGALSRHFGGTVTGFELLDRSRSGRVGRIRLQGSGRVVGAYEFRMATIRQIGGRVMKSTMFDIRREGSEYVLTGGGWGHGVGLSQYGAHGQAAEGRDYREILDFYFEGTTLSPYYAVGRTPATSGSRTTPTYASTPRAPMLLDPTTPTDPETREAMGLPTRPRTRAEREGRTPPPPASVDPATADRIEARLSGGGWSPSTRPEAAPEPEDDEAPAPGPAPAPRRRTAW